MLYYPNVTPVIWLGSKSGTTCTSVTLTAAYTGNRTTKYVSGYSEMTADIKYVTGSGEAGTTLDVKLEHSIDGTNFYTLTNEAASAGTSTLTNRTFAFAGGTGSTTYTLSYRLDISYKYIRLSVQEAGVSSNFGTAFVEGVLAGN